MIAIILAGGTGTRLWPYSRSMTPKQFLNLGSIQESLFQETCKRLESLVSPEDIYIVGADSHQKELKVQISQIYPNFRPEQLLLEPMGRNTKPDCPETGYGYIKAGEPLEVGFKVDEFVEKPDLATAEGYLKSSEYTWNASIFMATTETWLGEFRSHAPEMLTLFEEAAIDGNLSDPKVISEIYQTITADSIDYALLEKSNRVAVIPVDMEWTDLGSWESLFKVSEKDGQGNVIRGNVISQDSQNSLIFSSKKLVTSIGVDNLIIVETDDALLVCDMTRSQDVKKLVETLKREERNEY